MFENLLNKIKEPSTWAGLSVLGAIFSVPAGIMDGIGQIVAGAAAVLAVVLSEKAKKEDGK
ncbi:MAG: hypothetical protein LBD68_10610 [Zoogloeaceae bacterium]|jgi:hypothetical protein|nr:hypothetical protein [Zoogloeaceae bacterium]